MAVPSPENLERLAQLLEAGVLRVHIQNSYGLDQAGDALHALGATHTQGKLGSESPRGRSMVFENHTRGVRVEGAAVRELLETSMPSHSMR